MLEVLVLVATADLQITALMRDSPVIRQIFGLDAAFACFCFGAGKAGKRISTPRLRAAAMRRSMDQGIPMVVRILQLANYRRGCSECTERSAR